MLNSYMASEAKTELDELLSSVKGLKRHSVEEDGNDFGSTRRSLECIDRQRRIPRPAAAKETTIHRCFPGCILAAAGVRISRDDAIVPALRALNVTM